MEEETKIPQSGQTAIPVAQPKVNATNLVYVGFGRRLVAYIIDAFILGIIGSAFNFTVNTGNSITVSFVPGFVIGIVYTVGLWVYWNGQTIGKKAMGIRVLKEDGSPLDMGTGVVRYIGYYISAIVLFLGFFWIIWDEKKQGWHDKIAKTIVVKA